MAPAQDPCLFCGRPEAECAAAERDTEERACVVCMARERLRIELVQRGVIRVTAVNEYARPRSGTPPVERSKVVLTFIDGDFVKGDGSSVEEAIANALEHVPVTP